MCKLEREVYTELKEQEEKEVKRYTSFSSIRDEIILHLSEKLLNIACFFKELEAIDVIFSKIQNNTPVYVMNRKALYIAGLRSSHWNQVEGEL